MIVPLAAVVGIVAGWNCLYVLLAVLYRFRKNVPLGWRESLIFGFALLFVAAVLGFAAQGFDGFYRVADIFGAAVLAGAGLCQIWLCWRFSAPNRRND